jgi:hypothetical protein
MPTGLLCASITIRGQEEQLHSRFQVRRRSIHPKIKKIETVTRLHTSRVQLHRPPLPRRPDTTTVSLTQEDDEPDLCREDCRICGFHDPCPEGCLDGRATTGCPGESGDGRRSRRRDRSRRRAHDEEEALPDPTQQQLLLRLLHHQDRTTEPRPKPQHGLVCGRPPQRTPQATVNDVKTPTQDNKKKKTQKPTKSFFYIHDHRQTRKSIRSPTRDRSLANIWK